MKIALSLVLVLLMSGCGLMAKQTLAEKESAPNYGSRLDYRAIHENNIRIRVARDFLQKNASGFQVGKSSSGDSSAILAGYALSQNLSNASVASFLTGMASSMSTESQHARMRADSVNSSKTHQVSFYRAYDLADWHAVRETASALFSTVESSLGCTLGGVEGSNYVRALTHQTEGEGRARAYNCNSGSTDVVVIVSLGRSGDDPRQYEAYISYNVAKLPVEQYRPVADLIDSKLSVVFADGHWLKIRSYPVVDGNLQFELAYAGDDQTTVKRTFAL